MLLGRSSSRAPIDTFCKTNSAINWILFLESLVDSFWQKWTHNYFPSLLVQQKWHHTRRNIAIGDLVIISEKNLNRGQWISGKVVNTTIAGGDNVEWKYSTKTKMLYISLTLLDLFKV